MMSQIQGSLQGVITKVLDGDILVNHGGQALLDLSFDIILIE